MAGLWPPSLWDSMSVEDREEMLAHTMTELDIAEWDSYQQWKVLKAK